MASSSDGRATFSGGRAIDGGMGGGRMEEGGVPGVNNKHGGSRGEKMRYDVHVPNDGRSGVPLKWSSVARDAKKSREEHRTVSKEELDRLSEVFSETLDFSREELQEAIDEWRGKTLIGKFLGRRFDSEFVTKALLYRWKPKGDVEIIPTSNGFYLFRFSCTEYLVRVRTGGPTMVGGAVLALEEWRPCFKSNRDCITKATMWLRMPGLPSEYWRRSFVLAIASRAGRPIEVDFCTENMIRGGFARVCVEVDITKPLVAGALVGPSDEQFFQEFLYEGIGVYCFRCGVIGHRVHECSCDPKGVKIKVAKILDATGSVVDVQPESVIDNGNSAGLHKQSRVVEVEVTSELYGPWLSVSNNIRRQGGKGKVVKSVAEVVVPPGSEVTEKDLSHANLVKSNLTAANGSRFAALDLEHEVVMDGGDGGVDKEKSGMVNMGEIGGSRTNLKAWPNNGAKKVGRHKPISKLKLEGSQNKVGGPFGSGLYGSDKGPFNVELGHPIIFAAPNKGESERRGVESSAAKPLVGRGVLKDLNGRSWVKKGIQASNKGNSQIVRWDRSMSELLANGVDSIRPREPGGSAKRRRGSSPVLLLDNGDDNQVDQLDDGGDCGMDVAERVTSQEVVQGLASSSVV